MNWRTSWPAKRLGRTIPAKVVVFVPASEAVALSCTVPGRNANQIRRAAPYAIEEYVTGDIEAMHVACGQIQRNQPVRCLVAPQAKMADWLALLEDAGATPGFMTADAMALPVAANQASVLYCPQAALIRTEAQTASVDLPNLLVALAGLCAELGEGEGAEPGENDAPTLLQINGDLGDLGLSETGFDPLHVQTMQIGESPLQALAECVDGSDAVNLLQGAYAAKRRQRRQLATMAGGRRRRARLGRTGPRAVRGAGVLGDRQGRCAAQRGERHLPRGLRRAARSRQPGAPHAAAAWPRGRRRSPTSIDWPPSSAMPWGRSRRRTNCLACPIRSVAASAPKWWSRTTTRSRKCAPAFSGRGHGTRRRFRRTARIPRARQSENLHRRVGWSRCLPLPAPLRMPGSARRCARRVDALAPRERLLIGACLAALGAARCSTVSPRPWSASAATPWRATPASAATSNGCRPIAAPPLRPAARGREHRNRAPPSRRSAPPPAMSGCRCAASSPRRAASACKWKRSLFAKVIGWTSDLETTHGVQIVNARIDRHDDGVVNARFTLR